MKTLNLVQGSDEWCAKRAKYRTASEASVMMGCSSKATRGELVRMKATGSEKEFSRWVEEVLFARGHEIEAMARPIAEEIVGEELYPATGIDDAGYLLASFDGITMLEDIVWECKQWNELKAVAVRAGQVPEEDLWQVVQQLVASGAERCCYMVTDGTREQTVYCWFSLQEGQADRLIAGWRQFDRDVANYQHVEEAPKPEGAPVEALPAIRYQLNGLALTSNLKEYRAAADQLVEQSKRELQTDQDFADAEKRVKAFKEAEDRIAVVREQVVGEIKDVDQFCRELGNIGELIRQARLNSEKQVTARKASIRAEIKVAGEKALGEYLLALEEALQGEAGFAVNLRAISSGTDFAAAMKGKKNISSLRDAVDTTLANAKLDAAALAENIRTNIKALREHGGAYPFLFADGPQLVMKAPADLVELIKARVANHEAAEATRIEADRARIRQEEQQRLEREQRQREEQEAAEAERQRPAAAAAEPAPEATPALVEAAPQVDIGEAIAPAPTPAKVAPITQGVKRQRPTDAEIIEMLSIHYRARPETVVGWIAAMDVDAIRARHAGSAR